MKPDRNSHETGARLPCRDHPALCLSLFAFMFVPAVVGEIALGRWLTQFMPHPGLVAMLCFAPVMVILFHYRNAYWRYHLAFADEALCAAEHIGDIFSRRSARPGLLQSLLEDIFLELRSEPTENRSMSLLSEIADG